MNKSVQKQPSMSNHYMNNTITKERGIRKIFLKGVIYMALEVCISILILSEIMTDAWTPFARKVITVL